MTKGCLIFAHNGTLDYGSQAVVAAELAIKHLGVPVSLVADTATIQSVKEQFEKLPFDQIIEIAKPTTTNTRQLTDHAAVAYNMLSTKLGLPKNLVTVKPTKETIEFNNDSRVLAYELTPYDRTLVIDTDFLIFSDTLNKYWDLPQDFLISPGMLDLQEHTISPTGYEVNPFTIKMLWATTIMFSKTEETRVFFNLLQHIKDEYPYYANLYDFEPSQYRNDFAFSIACHIIGGHGVEKWHGELPVPLLLTDADTILEIKDDGQINFLLGDTARPGDFLIARSRNQDIHLMNKRDILTHINKLRELASA